MQRLILLLTFLIFCVASLPCVCNASIEKSNDLQTEKLGKIPVDNTAHSPFCIQDGCCDTPQQPISVQPVLPIKNMATPTTKLVNSYFLKTPTGIWHPPKFWV